MSLNVIRTSSAITDWLGLVEVVVQWLEHLRKIAVMLGVFEAAVSYTVIVLYRTDA